MNPERAGHQGRGPLPARDSGRRVGDGSAPPRRGHARGRDRRPFPSGRSSRRCSARGRPRRTRSTARSRRRPSLADAAAVMRQALAGMLWTKQFYYFDVDQWLKEHHASPLAARAQAVPQRGMVPHVNRGHHLDARQVGVPLVRRLGPGLPHPPARDGGPRLRQGAARPDAAANVYLHPNGQMPAYEWNFGDVNPPVHAFATLLPAQHREGRCAGTTDIDFLDRPSTSCCSTSPGG